MRQHRRKVLIRITERVAVGLILLDAALYWGLVCPLQKKVVAEQQRFAEVRRQVLAEQAEAARLEKLQAALPMAGDQVKRFLREHVPPRRQVFSRAARLVRRLTADSGVQLAGVAYHLDSNREEPLGRLRIEADVQGPFASLMNFAHAMETASDFILIRDFAFEPGEGGAMVLRVTADLYLVP